MFDIKKIDACVASNNEKLLKNKKLYPSEVKNEAGEVVYVQNYVAENWKIEKKRGRSGTYYQLSKDISDPSGKIVTIEFALSSDQVQYINYHKNNMLDSIAFGSSTTVPVKTRFVYGFSKGGLYVLCKVNLTDRIVIKNFISPLLTEILACGFSNVSTAFNIVMDRKSDLEELSDDDVEFL